MEAVRADGTDVRPPKHPNGANCAGMRRSGVLAGGIAAIAATASAAGYANPHPRDSQGRPARPVSVTVTPAVGSPDTRFLVRFKARNELRGKVFYDVEATGPEPARFGDCDDQTAIFRHARRGRSVRVRTPSRRTRRPNWCPGHYDGTVFLEDWRRGPGRDKAVGEFSFEVGAAP